MNSPFAQIITASTYDLKRSWGNVNISDCILKTYTKYGEKVDDKTFDKMISAITKGACNSAIARRRDPFIITNICKYFPKLLTQKNVTNILKCVNTTNFPQTSIATLLATGYALTESQIVQLNKAGYSTLDFLDTCSYKEFITLFDNSSFSYIITSVLSLDYSTIDGKMKIDATIASLQAIITKFDIVLEENFLQYLIDKKFRTTSSYRDSTIDLLNLHIIAKGIGFTSFKNSQFETLFTKKHIFYRIDIASGTIDQNTCKRIHKIIEFYDKPITRKFILEILSVETFVGLILPQITDYDPAEDIFYILCVLSCLFPSTCWMVVAHLIQHNYLIIDEFLVLLASLGLFGELNTNPNHPMRLVVQNAPERFTKKIIKNIYTFCNYDYIELLTELKIVPTFELASLIISEETMKHLIESSLFVDDNTASHLEDIVTYFIMSDNNKTVTDNIKKLKIYDSLSCRDKEIYSRISILDLSSIIRYRIKPTREMIEEFLCVGNLKFVVTLLHLSNTYDYILDFIDEQTLLRTRNLIARLWLHNNVINNKVESFALPNKFYENDKNVENDVQQLMSNQQIFYADEIRTQLIKKRQECRRVAFGKLTAANAALINSPTTTNGPVPGPVPGPMRAQQPQRDLDFDLDSDADYSDIDDLKIDQDPEFEDFELEAQEDLQIKDFEVETEDYYPLPKPKITLAN